jgi:hypothetical protein
VTTASTDNKFGINWAYYAQSRKKLKHRYEKSAMCKEEAVSYFETLLQKIPARTMKVMIEA